MPAARLSPALLPAVLVLIAAVLREPGMLPESFEQLAVGRCLLGLDAGPFPCSALDLHFWSPGWPVLAAAVGGVLPPLVAGGLVVLVAFFGLLLAVQAVGARSGPVAAVLAVVLVGLTPSVQLYAMTLDGRMVGLATAAGAVALLWSGGRQLSRRAVVLAGALAALAALSRPEHLLVVAGLAGALLLFERRRLLPFLVGALALLVPWWLALSLAEGRPVLLPRGVQAAGFALVPTVPEPWARALVGEGAARLPLRQALGAGPWPTDLAPAFGLDLLGGLRWLGKTLVEVTSPLVLLVAGLGAARLVKARQWRAVVLLGALALPGLAGIATPPGVEAELPMATLLPLVVAVLLLVPPALEGLRAPVAVVVGLALVAVAPSAAVPTSPENTEQGRAAAIAIGDRLPPETPVMASFSTSPLVHLAGLRWVPWSSPLAVQDPPAYAVVSASDVHWSPQDPALGRHARPLAAYGAGESAVLLLALDPP